VTPTNGDIEKYFKTYLEIEPVQEPALADVDPQLASIILSLIDYISRSDKGTILDIGCGIEVLTRGSRLHPNATGISVALGLNQEKIRNDIAAIQILNPIFDAHPNLTYAALPLMKISIRHGDTATARQIFERARKNSDNPFSSVLFVAEAEILNAERRPDAAIRLLETRSEKDQHIFGMLLESYYRLAFIAHTPAERISTAAKALSLEVPERFQNNIPIQINRCKLASLARDKNAFDGAIKTISAARTEKFEIEALEQSWNNPLDVPVV
jgi:predicted negative regulator of RcsB-dependent stress response